MIERSVYSYRLGFAGKKGVFFALSVPTFCPSSCGLSSGISRMSQTSVDKMQVHNY